MNMGHGVHWEPAVRTGQCLIDSPLPPLVQRHGWCRKPQEPLISVSSDPPSAAPAGVARLTQYYPPAQSVCHCGVACWASCGHTHTHRNARRSLQLDYRDFDRFHQHTPLSFHWEALIEWATVTAWGENVCFKHTGRLGVKFQIARLIHGWERSDHWTVSSSGLLKVTFDLRVKLAEQPWSQWPLLQMIAIAHIDIFIYAHYHLISWANARKIPTHGSVRPICSSEDAITFQLNGHRCLCQFDNKLHCIPIVKKQNKA